MKSTLWILAGSLVLVSAYAGEATPAAANLHELMKNVIAPQTQIVWDVSNAALDDNGEPSAAKLKPADWTKIASAAGKVKQASQSLAQAPHVMAAAPGQKIESEGNPGAFGARDVQKVLDAKPAVLRAFAQQLATSMDQIITSTQKKDAARLTEASGQLDQICEQCHLQFWYPNQKPTN